MRWTRCEAFSLFFVTKRAVTIEFVLWVPIFVGLFVFRPSHIMKDRVNSGGPRDGCYR
jgi:hypothetical protein